MKNPRSSIQSALSKIRTRSSDQIEPESGFDIKDPKDKLVDEDIRKRRKKIIVIGCGVLILLSITMGLVTYFAIVPGIIRSRFANSKSWIYSDNVTAILLKNNAVEYGFEGESNLGLGISGTLHAGSLQVATNNGEDIFMEITHPDIHAGPVDGRNKLSLNGYFKLANVDMLARIVSEMSQSGLADSLSTIIIQGKVALSALGIKWYSDLQIERKIPLKDVTFTNLASAVLDNTSWPGAISEIFPSEVDPTLEKYPRPAPKELKIPPINLTRISFVDNGLTIDTEILFDNILPINTKIPNAVIPIYVNDVMLSKIRIRRLEVTPPANTPSRLTPSIDLVNPPDVTADRLLNGVTQLLSPDAKVSVVGPIEWAKPIRYQGGKEEAVTTAVNEVSDEGAPWLSTITKGFRLDIRTRQLLGFLSRSGGLSVPDILKNLKVETESGSASLIPSRLKYRYNLDVPARGVPSFKFLYNIQAQAAFTSSVIDAVISDVVVQSTPSNVRISLTIELSTPTTSLITLLPTLIQTATGSVDFTVRNISFKATSDQVNECVWCANAFQGFNLPISVSSKVLLSFLPLPSLASITSMLPIPSFIPRIPI